MPIRGIFCFDRLCLIVFGRFMLLLYFWKQKLSTNIFLVLEILVIIYILQFLILEILYKGESRLFRAKETKKTEEPVDEQTRIIYENYENLLKRLMGTKVSIRKKKDDKGKIEIEYYSLEELERLLDLFQKLPGDDMA